MLSSNAISSACGLLRPLSAHASGVAAHFATVKHLESTLSSMEARARNESDLGSTTPSFKHFPVISEPGVKNKTVGMLSSFISSWSCSSASVLLTNRHFAHCAHYWNLLFLIVCAVHITVSCSESLLLFQNRQLFLF